MRRHKEKVNFKQTQKVLNFMAKKMSLEYYPWYVIFHGFPWFGLDPWFGIIWVDVSHG